MTFAELSLPFGLGLAGSLHCAQMCGPLVLSYSLTSGRDWRAHALYNLGRIATYAALGAIAGALGGVFNMAGQKTAMLVGGILMVVAGILILLPDRGLVQIGAKPLFSRSAGRFLISKNPSSKLFLGLFLGFLPCGLVYAALLRALAAGGALGGALAMAAFGLGTSFALFGIGMFSSFIGARLGRWSNQIAAASVLLMGILLIWHGLKPVGHHH